MKKFIFVEDKKSVLPGKRWSVRRKGAQYDWVANIGSQTYAGKWARVLNGLDKAALGEAVTVSNTTGYDVSIRKLGTIDGDVQYQLVRDGQDQDVFFNLRCQAIEHAIILSAKIYACRTKGSICLEGIEYEKVKKIA